MVTWTSPVATWADPGSMAGPASGDDALAFASPSDPKRGLAREVSQSLVLLALAGSSVGGVLGMIQIATQALGR